MAGVSDHIKSVRREYANKPLTIHDVDADPFRQFDRWFQEAIDSDIRDVNAMTLATVNREWAPRARIVLLRDIDERGLVFFTNYQSEKGTDLAHQPAACLNFFWVELDRQVRVTGRAEKVEESVSDAYFKARPRDSQIGAWASEQSKELEGREALDEKYREMAERFAESDIPRPPHWGGYRIVPDGFEFWQGRESRLHDRILYRVDRESGWEKVRLAP